MLFKIFLVISVATTLICQTVTWTELAHDGEQALAEERFQQALELLRSAWKEGSNAEPLSRARLAFLLGNAYQKLGNIRESVPLLEQARRTWEQHGIIDSNYLLALSTLGEALLAQDRYQDAEILLQAALRVAREKVQTPLAIGSLLSGLG